MSVFDPATFAQMTFNDSNSTESAPIPVGKRRFMIEKAEITSWQKKDNPNESGLKCTLMLKNEGDAEVEEITGRKVNKARYEIMLDITPEGGLDFGKGMNVRLGRAREAVGLNRPGHPFSFDMFVGHEVVGDVTHEPYNGTLQVRIKEIAKAD